jgi:hypothetical protein
LQRLYSLIASGLLLSVILASITIVAITTTPNREQALTSTSLIVSRETSSTNLTTLAVKLFFPNGTGENVGEMYAGSFESQHVRNQYLFDNITPGTYQRNLTGASGIYFPSGAVRVSSGTNFLNITVYQLEAFDIVVTAGPTLNYSSPGPTITVLNGTMVRFAIYNNTTLIQNLAVVKMLNNTESSNVLFNSSSDTINAGGSVNDTFVVSKVGSFFYECLIGNDARDGESGQFIVV